VREVSSSESPTALGRLVLVPNTLDLGTDPSPIQDVLSDGALRRAASLSHWVVENAKTARAFLKRAGEVHPLIAPLQSLSILELPRPRKGGGHDPHEGNPDAHLLSLLQPAQTGIDIGLLSEAGLPAVADPGALLVKAAHQAGIAIEVLSGGSSLTLALAASGLNGQRFAFEGYLPQQTAERNLRIRELEARSRKENQTQLVIETPYRNAALLEALIQTLQPSTLLSVACGLTSHGGFCRTRTVAQWRKQEMTIAMPDRLPAVFLWLAH
jgi:16S rRNA (cytidine1402-2'-O)-methyltransferase